MQDKLTVLILAAGYGRRMGPFSRMVNKGLIPYDNKPLISHIIEKFDTDTKFVIACGHMGQQVKDYVDVVHDDKNIIFVDIDNYAEGDTGPATTIRMCQEHIRGGFMWLACDTLFEFDYRNKLDHNWIGVCPVDSTIAHDYCWIEREADAITNVVNKTTSSKAVDAFIGLMYAKDDEYLDNLLSIEAKETYEGFAGLELRAHTVRDWKDFGTYEKWQELSSEFSDVSFPKPNELFYSDNGKIIKYWTNPTQAQTRHHRSLRLQHTDSMPTNITVSGNFLVHDYAHGDIVYNQATPILFEKMLNWCQHSLWIKTAAKTNESIRACREFYLDKTVERLNQFRAKYAQWSEPCVVNGISVKSIDEYIDLVDFDYLLEDVAWCFIHGDLHFDNTIYDPITDKFTAIDWRTDFAGQLEGDLYYDLAKMLGGIWLSYKDIKLDDYSYTEHNNNAIIEIPSVEDAQEYENILRDWVKTNNYDWNKVKLLVPIIYLNMSPLHEPPFDKFLIALAQLHFSKIL